MNETRAAGGPARMSSPDTANAMPLSPGQSAPVALLVELVERAAARLMRRELSSGQTSISMALNLRQVSAIHSSPDTWRVRAYLVAARGRVHEFELDVFDDSGVIASAEHTRAVVVATRVLAIARRRVGRPAMLLRV
jgi:predicted thioesterase